MSITAQVYAGPLHDRSTLLHSRCCRRQHIAAFGVTANIVAADVDIRRRRHCDQLACVDRMSVRCAANLSAARVNPFAEIEDNMTMNSQDTECVTRHVSPSRATFALGALLSTSALDAIFSSEWAFGAATNSDDAPRLFVTEPRSLPQRRLHALRLRAPRHRRCRRIHLDRLRIHPAFSR
jgi:hypothetical protein